MGTGIFIAFEGGEGAGKTTQIKRLSEYLASAERSVTITREPGGSAIGKRLRKMLLEPATGALDPRTEALLFAADRAEHVASVVRPALDRGGIVISDRYMDSSIAYQGSGRGLSRREVFDLSLWATDGLLPDLTVVLDIDPLVGLRRATQSEFGAADRFESEAIEFAIAVREGFLSLAAADPGRYLVVDATNTSEAIASEVAARVARLIESFR